MMAENDNRRGRRCWQLGRRTHVERFLFHDQVLSMVNPPTTSTRLDMKTRLAKPVVLETCFGFGKSVCMVCRQFAVPSYPLPVIDCH